MNTDPSKFSNGGVAAVNLV
ncbi:uncharacterized protein G2W53_041310 [Senna tora]|uniref:Uncharacterized protein n=1 Tax=Senna tora TaxID=362788 RepID=A0A834SRR6_9FABA|nr:uncharacterized protein G2W53_041310 [Senna tora]